MAQINDKTKNQASAQIESFSHHLVATRLIGVISHTLMVYLTAVIICPRLVALWFGVLLPLSRWHTTAAPANWYISHLPMISIIPAAAIGFFIIQTRIPGAKWAWLIPFVVLLYSILSFRHYSSVFERGKWVDYFFGRIFSVPTVADPGGSDPVRVLKQMIITAPFYTGVGYSAGYALRWMLRPSKL